MKIVFLLIAYSLFSTSFCKAQDTGTCKSFSIVKDVSDTPFHPYDTLRVVLKNTSAKAASYSIEAFIYAGGQWHYSYTYTKYYNRISSDSEMERIYAPENKGATYNIPADFHLPLYTIKANNSSMIQYVVDRAAAFTTKLIKFRFTIYDDDLNRCYLFSAPFPQCRIL